METDASPFFVAMNPSPLPPDDTQEMQAIIPTPEKKPAKSKIKKPQVNKYTEIVKKHRGQQNRLTPEVAELIYEAIEAGGILKDAAAVARVGQASLQKWLRYGDLLNQAFPDGPPEGGFTDQHYEEMKRLDPEITKTTDLWPLLMDLYATCDGLRAGVALEMIRTIRRASKRNWFAAAWWLERTDPERWALGRNRELGGATVIQNNTVTVNQINVSETERAAEILQILHEFGGIAPGIDRTDDAEADEVYPALPPPEASGFPPSELP